MLSITLFDCDCKFMNTPACYCTYGTDNSRSFQNSCTVTAESDRKSKQIIRRLIAKTPGSVIIVTGCYSQINPQDAMNIKGVSLVCGNNDKSKIAKMAIELYKELLTKQPNERIEQNLTAASIAYGYSLYDKQDYGQAILYFEDAIDLNNKEASAHFGYARANAKLGIIDTALSSYEKAVLLAPGNIEYATELNKYREENKISVPDNETKTSFDEPILNVIPPAVEEDDKEE